MLPRTLEPEVMDTAEEASDYDAMDHGTVNRVFAENWRAVWTARHPLLSVGEAPVRLLDVGTGTALIPIAFCRQTEDLHLTAVDLAEEMLRLAARNVAAAGCAERVTLERIDAKRLPYRDGQFDSVVSNSIIHHIPEPLGSLREMVRVLRPGGLLFVRDLYRPNSVETIESLVQQYAGGETERQQQLFRQSFHAALTLVEVGDLMERCSVPRDCVRMTSDRHWTIEAWKAG